jgi:cell division protein FtsB
METEHLKLVVILIIVVSAISAEIVKYHLKIKSKTSKSQGNDEFAGLKQENTALKARIEVLERLVTEDSFELKQQFKHL